MYGIAVSAMGQEMHKIHSCPGEMIHKVHKTHKVSGSLSLQNVSIPATGKVSSLVCSP